MAWQPDYVTLDELGGYLRIDDIIDDAELAVAITAASRAVDHYTNRQFGLVDAAEERLYTAWPNYLTGYWTVEIDDLMVTGSPVVEVDGTSVSTFRLGPLNAPQKGQPYTYLEFTREAEVQPTGVSGEVSVAAQWGWTTVPVAVTQATLLQSSRFVKRRDAPFGVAGSPDVGSEMRLLAKVDPDVAVSLHAYRRMRSVY